MANYGNQSEDLAYGEYHQQGEGDEGERGFVGDVGRRIFGKKPQGEQSGSSGQKHGIGFVFDKLQDAVQQIGSEVKDKISSQNKPAGQSQSGYNVATAGPNAGNRFLSFAPERHGNDIKWYVDGCGYFWAVSVALEQARESVWILDWWLSPELYLRRPPSKNEQYRVDRMLQAAAQRGVKVNIMVYKEVTQALTLSSDHTKHALESLHPNIAVFRHPDHLPDGAVLASNILSSLQHLTLNAASQSKLPSDSLKAIYGTHEDTVLYWAHHEKLCLIDGHIAFMGGLDMCFGRWDTNQHSIADAHPGDLNRIVFPGQDYNNARIMDFDDVVHWQNNKLDRTKSSRMGWSDVSLCVTGPVVKDLQAHFVQRWNFIYNEKYSKKDVRYQPLQAPNTGPGPTTDYPNQPGGGSYGQPPQQPGSGAYGAPPPQQGQGMYFPPPPSQAHRGVEGEYEGHRGVEEGERGYGHEERERGYGREEHERGHGREEHERGFGAEEGERGFGGEEGEGERGLFGRGRKFMHRMDEEFQQAEGRYGHHHHQGQTGSGVSCQITRSSAKWSHGITLEHSIQNAYCEVIRNSQHFVYIENQFFITATSDKQKPVKNQIGAAIVERILRAARNGEKYKMIVLMPSVPAFAGDLRADDALGTRAIMEFQYNSINRGGNSIYECIAREGFNPMEYIRFYNLRNYDRINASGVMAQVQQQTGVSYEDARKEHDAVYGSIPPSQSGQTYQPPQGDYQSGQTQYQSGQQQYQSGQQQYQSGQTQYQPGQPQYQSDQSQYRSSQPPYQSGQADYQSGQSQYQSGQSQYQPQQSQQAQYQPYHPSPGTSSGYGQEPTSPPPVQEGYQAYHPPGSQQQQPQQSQVYEMPTEQTRGFDPSSEYEQSRGFDQGGAFQQYQQGAQQVGDRQGLGSGRWDTVAECYMSGGEDIRKVPWEGGGMNEIDAFVSEELYIHSKLLIADDRTVICGSANLNDRSQVGDHDSEIAIIINDFTPQESTLNGRPWRASKFATSLRRQLFRKHLGLLRPQDYEKPDNNFQPVGVPNSYDWGSPEDNLVVDPMADGFLNFWNSRAKKNTDAFARVFHPVPFDGVRTWKQYDDYYERYFKEDKDAKKPSKYKWGHVVAEDFRDVAEVKEVLSQIKGTLVEMPLLFLKDEDIAKEGLGLNAFTEEVYT